MKRIAVWVFYGIGALAMLYLALFAYATFTGRDLQPGDPIHIFRKPDAPDYSAAVRKTVPARGDPRAGFILTCGNAGAITPARRRGGSRRRRRV